MKLWVLSVLVLTGTIQAAPQQPSFHFREPNPARYRFEEGAIAANRQWIIAVPENSPTNHVQIGARIVLQIDNPAKLTGVLAKRPVSIARRISDNVVILQAPDALTAMQQADQISRLPGVTTCHPVMRRPATFDAVYAALPTDPYFKFQYYFENRTIDGNRIGADLNIRGAWPHARGAGVTIAIADTGFELDHPELIANAFNSPHFNFETGEANGAPPNNAAIHGTAVAGLAAAANNGVGLVGAAPDAKLASWVMIGTNQALQSRLFLVDDESLMDMFQYQSNAVHVQNHSWGHPGSHLDGPALLPRIGISNAIAFGRDGLGTVMVRSGGNGRLSGNNANDNSYRSDPRVVAVAATAYNGRAASYSNPGACLLVAAIGAELGQDMFTTDRQGTNGYNTSFRTLADSNYWDYAFWFFSTGLGTAGFGGTSAAAPQISGLVALLLSANPNLTYRDVQQILVHSSQHFDFADPGLSTNGAGFLVSHNVGFGLPDAGEAVRLAMNWQNRPALTTVSYLNTNPAAIPDAGLRVHVTGDNLPANLNLIVASPSRGIHPDSPTQVLPVVDVGLATTTISLNLTNKAALIQRGINDFDKKIINAAQAGAAFAIIYNNSTNPIFTMGNTDFVPIPAVFIPQIEGEALRDFIATNSAETKLELTSAISTFQVTNTLVCEHIGLRVKSDHPWRGDLRITLTSPNGTRSVLQQLNTDTNAFPGSWTFFSTHHFYESTAGAWTVAVTDEFPEGAGSIEELELIISGIPITDSDADGLDDSWEMTQFGSLAFGPTDDPDKDGYNNAREQILGTNPLQPNAPLQIDLSRLNSSYFRASWPGSPHFDYEIWSGTDVGSLNLVTNVSGRFPESECILSATNATQFLRIVARPKP
ncbi:MAG: S8 family serine peptidase [Verrucomicrobia bacterium]|nr:S8 family serine peptidase [Verrucomicrobiota bacterium]